MKKTATFLILFLASIFNINSQTTLKEWDEIKRDNPDTHLDNLLKSDATGFYSVAIRTKGRGTDYYIEKFSKQGELVFSKVIKEYPYFTLIANKSLYLFYTQYDENTQKKTLSYEQLSTDNGEKQNEVQLEELSSDKWGTSGRNFYMSLSPDKTKLMIVPQFQWNGKPEETKIKLYDASSLKLISQKDLKNESDGYQVQTNSFRVDNEGNVLLTYRYAKNLEDFKTGENVGGSLGVVKAKSKDITMIEINIGEDKNLTSYKLDINDDGNAMVAGIFKDPEIKGRKKRDSPVRRAGVFYASVDMSTAKLNNQTTTYFTPEVEAKLTYKSAGGMDPGDKYLTAFQLIEMNKNTYFIAEQSYSVTVSSSNGGGSTTDYALELIVSKINPSGKVEWMKIIPKSTGSREKSSLSDETASTNYNLVIYNNKLNFIYLDHPKNKKFTIENYEPGKLGMVSGVNGANVLMVTVNESGDATKNVIHENDGFSVIPQSEDILLEKNTLLMYLRKGKSEKFGTIILE